MFSSLRVLSLYSPRGLSCFGSRQVTSPMDSTAQEQIDLKPPSWPWLTPACLRSSAVDVKWGQCTASRGQSSAEILAESFTPCMCEPPILAALASWGLPTPSAPQTCVFPLSLSLTTSYV